MKYITIALIFISISAASMAEMPYNFLVGEYEVVGKKEKGELYSGTVSITEAKDGISVVRVINGIKTTGIGKFDYITADKIQVLKVRFSEGKDKPVDTYYNEATYNLGSNADNYPILTGVIYMPAMNSLHKPDIETLYSKESYLER